MIGGSLDVFATCPQSLDTDREVYLRRVIEVARWSEEAGCRGILVYTDNGIVDPWLVAQIIIENTAALRPLVAVQPVYMHPYAVAKMVTSLAFMHGRQVHLNMVAGGFRNDLLALDDTTPHDRRYDRLVEYVTIIRRLLTERTPLTFAGEFYRVSGLRLTPPLPAALTPGIFLSGSSEAGLAAAEALRATAVQYPEPPDVYESGGIQRRDNCGIRVGIIARPDHDEAWHVARTRFPEDRKGELTHQLAMKVSDSRWHQQLSQRPADAGGRARPDPYWLGPFQHSKTNCPYLVGSYETVAEELARYIGIGYQTYILDIPPSEEELAHIGVVFGKAQTLR